MVIFAFALALAAAPSGQAVPPTVAAERQATAMVRIVTAPPIRFAEIEKHAPKTLTDAHVRMPDGTAEPARLVEFQ